MPLYRCFQFLSLDAYIPLCDRRTAVLQQLLNKSDIVPIVLVNLRGIELPKAMGADTLIPQILTYDAQLFLDLASCQREHKSMGGDLIIHAVEPNKLIQSQRDSENTGFSGFLFYDG